MAAGPSRPDGSPQQAPRSVPSRSIWRSAQAAHCARTRPAAAHRRSSPDPSDSPSAQRPANHKSENPSLVLQRSREREREAARTEHTSQPLDPQRLALEVAAHARAELAAMGESGGPMNANMSLVERKRRADIIASLSRSIERIDRTFEACAEREALKRLVKKQQDKIYALENAGMLEAQRTTLATLKDEFNRQR